MGWKIRECSMTPQVTSIPQLLIETRGNQTAVGRAIKSTRITVRKYARDFNCRYHVVVNGVLMVSQGDRGLHKRKSNEENMVHP
ncbi:protein ninH [Pantoea agglomerans]|uniref:protein ninH n=2 Tax=Enterobacter agglomerans TaxID=549 RepID=UPI00292A56EC|nr:protein ninH [Pantoea agglomerans]